MYVQAIKYGHGYECVPSSTNSPVDSYLCVCMGSNSGSHALDVCVFVHSYVRSRVGMGVCMSGIITLRSYVKSRVSRGVGVRHHHSTVDSYLCVYVC